MVVYVRYASSPTGWASIREIVHQPVNHDKPLQPALKPPNSPSNEEPSNIRSKVSDDDHPLTIRPASFS